LYKKIKENIVNPRKLINRRNDKFGISLLYFIFLVVLMSVPSMISTFSFDGFTPNNRAQIKVALEEQIDVPCSIDYGLVCDDDELRVIELPNLTVYLDPAGEFIPDSFALNVVLREDNVYVFSARQVLLSTSYGGPSDTDSLTIWPSEWSQIEIDSESDVFWENFFGGLEKIVDDYKNLWLPISILTTVFVFIIILLTEILIDTLILMLFRVRRLKFREVFKIVLNAMTVYVIISVILELYSINLGGFLQAISQMVPLVYVLIAIRIPIKR